MWQHYYGRFRKCADILRKELEIAETFFREGLEGVEKFLGKDFKVWKHFQGRIRECGEIIRER